MLAKFWLRFENDFRMYLVEQKGKMWTTLI